MDEGAELENNLAMAVERIDPVGPVQTQSVSSGMCRDGNDDRSERRKFGPMPQRKVSMDFAREKKIILGVAFGVMGLFVAIVGCALIVVLGK